MRRRQIDRGMKFGRLTVIEETQALCGRRRFTCVCECGSPLTNVAASDILYGNTKSCGCLQKEIVANRSTKHGGNRRGKRERLYRIWYHMKDRCLRPNIKEYKYYGARGIKINPAWMDYVTFRDWALANGYADNLTIERRDVNGDYCPENCCWIPRADQPKNRRYYEVSHKDPITGRFIPKIKGGKHGNRKRSSSKTGTGGTARHSKARIAPCPHEKNARRCGGTKG